MENETPASGALPLAGDKAELLALMRSARAELERVAHQTDQRQLTDPIDRAGWTAKDHLAHVVAWEQFLLGRLAGQPEHEAAGLSRDTYDALTSDGTADPVDALNELILQRWQTVPLNEVLQSFADSYAEVVQTIAEMSDADLAAPLDGDSEKTAMRRIAEDTYWHYADHADWIGRFVRRS